MEIVWGCLLAAAAGLCGSVPVGWIAVRLRRGVDVRTCGSGNIGTANVMRVAGPRLAAVVLTADVLKGVLPVLAARQLGLGPAWQVAAAVAAVAGHNWSPFLGFRGGKGVATSFGGLLALEPLAAAGVAAVWLVAVVMTRYSSVGSMAAGLAAPLFLALLRAGTPEVVYGVLGAALILLQHRGNIRRLLRGEELPIWPPSGGGSQGPGAGASTGA
ncbi:MAG: glycerol-3-phosphate 1-O-acyltransferase PlsY [Firmicutes bacterium]|nr:glycerol-3-phosphate 1-O-acyltransferase PlsY [Bacillota bacterium]